MKELIGMKEFVQVIFINIMGETIFNTQSEHGIVFFMTQNVIGGHRGSMTAFSISDKTLQSATVFTLTDTFYSILNLTWVQFRLTGQISNKY